MKVLLSWLHELLPIQPTAAQVREALTSVGIEVTQCRFLGGGMEDVVAAKILERDKHPDADRLSLCRVTDGVKEYSIVCGADNMKTGDCVALARIGAKLPNGMVLKRTVIRGVESEGMLCSQSELALSEESEGILILPEGTPPGAKLADVLKRNDWLLELDLTPNRGDCLGVIGVAREVAAALDVAPKVPVFGAEGPKEGNLKAFVHDASGSQRYVLRYLHEMKVGPSPVWMAFRLEACGVRAINNVVDVTNYVMLEWGQPMHAFDRDKVAGTVSVRRAKENEKILCLDGIERELKPVDLVIADDEGPIAVAGVMGGQRTAVSETTRGILLESAYFNPKSVRATARRLALHSESSHRFERGVDPAAAWSASIRAVELFAKVSGAKEVSSVDLRAQPPAPKKLTLRRATLERVLGEDVKKAGECLARLGFPTEKLENGWVVEVPPRRSDLEREIDLVEEVARLTGYNNFASRIPPPAGEPEANVPYDGLEHIRTILAGAGFREIKTYSFASEADLKTFSTALPAEPVRLTNPIAAGAEFMRQSLVPSTINVWKFNQARQCEGLRAFEVGSVYGKADPTSSTPAREELRLVCCLAGVIEAKTWDRPERAADYFDGRGAVEFLLEQLKSSPPSFERLSSSAWLHPGKSANVVWRKKDLGIVGEVHPRVLRQLDLKGPVVVADLSLPPILDALGGSARYKPFSAFPSIQRDLAFVVNRDVSAEKFFTEIRKLREPLMRDVELFDRYEGKGIPEGQVSLAFRLTFGSFDRTLKDEEVDGALKKIVAHIHLTCGAQLRGN